jgi:hypothetical protein
MLSMITFAPATYNIVQSPDGFYGLATVDNGRRGIYTTPAMPTALAAKCALSELGVRYGFICNVNDGEIIIGDSNDTE